MAPEEMYESCLLALGDEAVGDEERAERVEEVLRTAPFMLRGKILEDAVLDTLWRLKLGNNDSWPPYRLARATHVVYPAPVKSRSPERRRKPDWYTDMYAEDTCDVRRLGSTLHWHSPQRLVPTSSTSVSSVRSWSSLSTQPLSGSPSLTWIPTGDQHDATTQCSDDAFALQNLRIDSGVDDISAVYSPTTCLDDDENAIMRKGAVGADHESIDHSWGLIEAIDMDAAQEHRHSSCASMVAQDSGDISWRPAIKGLTKPNRRSCWRALESPGRGPIPPIGSEQLGNSQVAIPMSRLECQQDTFTNTVLPAAESYNPSIRKIPATRGDMTFHLREHRECLLSHVHSEPPLVPVFPDHRHEQTCVYTGSPRQRPLHRLGCLVVQGPSEPSESSAIQNHRRSKLPRYGCPLSRKNRLSSTSLRAEYDRCGVSTSSCQLDRTISHDCTAFGLNLDQDDLHGAGTGMTDLLYGQPSIGVSIPKAPFNRIASLHKPQQAGLRQSDLVNIITPPAYWRAMLEQQVNDRHRRPLTVAEAKQRAHDAEHYDNG